MYKSIRVKRLRGFQDLSVDDLGQINLIAGTNNVGKTALLEAVFMHSGPTNPMLPLSIGTFRGMNVAYKLPPSGPSPWDSLFHNFDLEQPIEISSKDREGRCRTLRLKRVTGPVATISTEDAASDASRASAGTTGSHGWALSLETEQEGKTATYQIVLSEKGAVVADHPAPPFPTVFVFFQKSLADQTVSRFSELTTQRRSDPLINVMKLIEPRIENLIVAAPAGTPTLWADLDGLSALLPVEALGDGVCRALTIAAAIGACPEGVVLIDEVGVGIHHSKLGPFWDAIVRLALDLDVQLFATTHSHECLVAALTATRRLLPDDIFRLHRLDRVGGRVEAVTYDSESLDAAVAADIEVW